MRTKNGGIQSQKDALGRTLVTLALKHNKPYVWVTMKTLRLFISKYHGINVSPRTLGRRMAEMRDEGYLVRELRTMPDGKGGRKFTSSLTFLKRKLFQWVEKMERFARKVFSFFRRPSLAYYSLEQPKRDLRKPCGIVEILLKSTLEGRASPPQGIL